MFSAAPTRPVTRTRTPSSASADMRGDHRGPAGHVGLHRLHAFVRLQRQPAAVERDALADQHHVVPRAARVIAQLDHARRLRPTPRRRPGCRRIPRRPARPRPGPVAAARGRAADRGGLLGQPGRRLDVGRHVDQVPGQRDGGRDRRPGAGQRPFGLLSSRTERARGSASGPSSSPESSSARSENLYPPSRTPSTNGSGSAPSGSAARAVAPASTCRASAAPDRRRSAAVPSPTPSRTSRTTPSGVRAAVRTTSPACRSGRRR